jgi:hypothetical protein
MDYATAFGSPHIISSVLASGALVLLASINWVLSLDPTTKADTRHLKHYIHPYRVWLPPRRDRKALVV